MATYTARQRDVLDFIRRTIEERGIAPTLEEIGEELGGISRVSVLDHLRALEKKGAIRRRARESRAIEILDRDFMPARAIPLEGSIAAGEPILEVADREDIALEEYLGVDDGCFLLRVRGDSMIDDHICDGDLVLVESGRTARNGDTVVAVVNEEVTLKRLYREKGKIRLQPANSKLRARSYPTSAVQIRGILRGVIRRS
jgi:repressor LexA